MASINSHHHQLTIISHSRLIKYYCHRFVPYGTAAALFRPRVISPIHGLRNNNSNNSLLINQQQSFLVSLCASFTISHFICSKPFQLNRPFGRSVRRLCSNRLSHYQFPLPSHYIVTLSCLNSECNSCD